MRLRIWPFVGGAFGVLLLLVALSVWQVVREIRALDSRTAQVHEIYQTVDADLTDIRNHVYRASAEVGGQSNLSANRVETGTIIQRLQALLDTRQRVHLNNLRKELDDYWAGVANMPLQREKILEIAGQLDELNTDNVNRQENEIEERAMEFQRFLKRTALFLLLLSVAIAGGTTYYLSRIEREAGRQKERAEQAELELRRLSNQLVNAQEAERKSISRELHDEVGQLLTGLRLELGSLRAVPEERLESVKSLAELSLRTVRNLAMLLRPSMLDDLGLPAALRWQAKEFTRRTGIDAVVRINGDVDTLPDAHRTCLYRVIQEATTNIARHANAKRAVITVSEEQDKVIASVTDDGQGFQQNGSSVRGIGLVGMEERARELRGHVTIKSHPGQGTILTVELPHAQRA